MKLRNLLLLAVVAVLSFAVVSKAAPAKTLVYQVDHVVARKVANTVVIHAFGKVRTGGWKAAELVATRDAANVLAFRFVAVKPTGIVTQMITPIEAQKTTGPLLPPFLQKVKIIAKTNSKTVSITQSRSIRFRRPPSQH